MTKPNNAYSGTPFDLTGKVSLISGGAGLLGTEFCKALFSAGSHVIIADNNKDELYLTEQKTLEINGSGSIITKHIDVTNIDSIKNCIRLIKEKFGTIDVLVNSAAIDPKFDKDSDVSKYTGFKDFSLELWNKSVEVNLTGCFLLTQQVCNIMERNRKGSIINLGSNYGLIGPDQRIYKKKGQENQQFKPPVYSVCKAGIIGFTKYLAAYYSGTNIRVNVLTPSGVYNNQDEEFVQNYSSRTILQRMSKKNEYWGSIIFLASDASSYMTGANLIIDGGWTAI